MLTPGRNFSGDPGIRISLLELPVFRQCAASIYLNVRQLVSWLVSREKTQKCLLSKPLLRPGQRQFLQYTRQFTCTSVQLDQPMCVRYNWAKQSVCTLPFTMLRCFNILSRFQNKFLFKRIISCKFSKIYTLYAFSVMNLVFYYLCLHMYTQLYTHGYTMFTLIFIHMFTNMFTHMFTHMFIHMFIQMLLIQYFS